MIKSPLITIAISCYNSSDTVADAINSALAQDWHNKEILIADDGSSDNTIEVIKETIKGHNNSRLIINNKNLGFAGSLNNLINEANGEFFAIFDDDDISDPRRVTRQYKRITNYETSYHAEMVICHVARIQKFQNNYERYEPTMGTDESYITPHGFDVVDRILIGRLIKGVVGSCANCSRMARTSIFRKMNGYDRAIRRGEDTDFNIRLAINGGHFVGIKDPLVTQTMTMGQEKTLDQERKVELIILEKNKEYLESIGWYSFSLLWIEARYDNLQSKYFDLFKKLIYLSLRHPIKLINKLCWAVPAYNTRRDFKKWHNAKLDN